MPQFWRIFDNQLYDTGTVDQLGFPVNDPSFIPDEYLAKQEFVICRTCLGIGDWSVLAAMPRLLKEKYPNCIVKMPSEQLQRSIFEPFANEWLKSWSNPFKTFEYIFKNNPYIDEFIDSIDGDVYHDHFRCYDPSKPNTPLLEQMLRFWQFKDNELQDSAPELYFSKDEIEHGNKIINEFTDGIFGTLLISNRYNEERDGKFIRTILNRNKIPYFYFIADQNIKIPVKGILDLHHVPVRIQLYIKSKAKLIVCNQSGMDITFPRYTDVYMAPKDKDGLGSNMVKGRLHLNIEENNGA